MDAFLKMIRGAAYMIAGSLIMAGTWISASLLLIYQHDIGSGNTSPLYAVLGGAPLGSYLLFRGMWLLKK